MTITFLFIFTISRITSSGWVIETMASDSSPWVRGISSLDASAQKDVIPGIVSVETP